MFDFKYYPILFVDLLRTGADYIRLGTAEKRMPSGEARRLIDDAVKNVTHPFILAREADFERVRTALTTDDGDGYIKSLATYALSEADKLLDTTVNPPYEYYFTDGERLLEVSRCALSRIMTLGFAWRVTRKECYAIRAVEELDSVCAFPDWHEKHLLDAVEMGFAVTLGADWLFDYISCEKRERYASTVHQFEIRHAVKHAPFTNWYSWSKTNWNTVCYSATLICLLGFSDFYPDEAARYLSRAMYSMPIAFSGFEPDGVFAEGNGYWKYACSYFAYLVTTYRNFFGIEPELLSYSGCKSVGLFPLYVSTPCGVFNTGDNKNEKLHSASLFMFAKSYREPLLLEYQKRFEPEAFRPRESALGALWYEQVNGSEKALPLSLKLRSSVSQEFAFVRSSYLDNNAFFFGIKGGNNFVNHGDLDIGTFVLESGGVRWAEESGPANYNAKGYFNPLPGGGRYKNYRKRAEGHNTLCINPGVRSEDQYPFARCRVTEFEELAGGAGGAVDMTAAYTGHGVKSAVRRFKVTDGYSRLLLEDIVECKSESDIYWFMHTRAQLELSKNNRSCTLTRDNKSITVNLLTPEDAVLEIRDAVPLPESPPYTENSDNSGLRKLAIIIRAKSTAVKVEIVTAENTGNNE